MAINVQIELAQGEPVERALRRFSKRCKKERIISDVIERLYFQSKAQKHRKRSRKRKKSGQKNDRR